MTEEFTPPGEGWIEGGGPWETAVTESITYSRGSDVYRVWHRKIEPPLPTEPGFYLSRSQRVWERQHDGGWVNANHIRVSQEEARRHAPFTRLVPEDEHRALVAEEIRAAIVTMMDGSSWIADVTQTINAYLQDQP